MRKTTVLYLRVIWSTAPIPGGLLSWPTWQSLPVATICVLIRFFVLSLDTLDALPPTLRTWDSLSYYFQLLLEVFLPFSTQVGDSSQENPWQNSLESKAAVYVWYGSIGKPCSSFTLYPKPNSLLIPLVLMVHCSCHLFTALQIPQLFTSSAYISWPIVSITSLPPPSAVWSSFLKPPSNTTCADNVASYKRENRSNQQNSTNSHSSTIITWTSACIFCLSSWYSGWTFRAL